MSGEKLRIILVDDNDIDIVVNTKLLRLANLTEHIESYSDGPEAVKKINSDQEKYVGFLNVLLLDIQMPDVDGFETLAIFEELPEDFRKDFKIFMLSSSIDRSDIEKAEQNKNIIKVLEKPLDVYLLKRLAFANANT